MTRGRRAEARGAAGAGSGVASVLRARDMTSKFAGFPKDTVRFLRALARNNSEEWMRTNRARYEASILTPARAAVVAVGEALVAAGCQVVADPRVNGSIFRIARDRRFRPDAPPYKAHLALLWWADAGPLDAGVVGAPGRGGGRMELPSFYIQIATTGGELGVGLPEVPRQQLPQFRSWLVERDNAARFLATIDAAAGAGVEWYGTPLLRAPHGFRGLDTVRDRAVRYRGVWGGWTLGSHPPELFTGAFAEWFVESCRPLMPFWQVFSEGLRAARGDSLSNADLL